MTLPSATLLGVEPVWAPPDVSDWVLGGESALPPLPPQLQVVRGALLTMVVLTFGLLLQVVVVSGLQHRVSQTRALESFRGGLATGTAAIGATDADGAPVDPGTPVALLDIPAIDVYEVVVEGTAASQLFVGPGHRRDTPLPGQIGTSVVFGRRAAYGGPFSGLSSLDLGDEMTVTTGQGTWTYQVVGIRTEGDPLPPPVAQGGARLTLATAAGAPFVPSGVVWVDADLVGEPVGGQARVISTTSLPDDEGAMRGELGSLWILAFWLQALLLAAIAAVWSWYRWNPVKTWLVATPVLVLVGLATAGEVVRFLPNMT